jgi:YD repeat-containing protein
VSITQNAQSAQSQTRTYSYDDLGRMTSEATPEANNLHTYYTYDSDSTCGVTSAGDLVKKSDPIGNTTCYAYDALHRQTGITVSGPYGTSTPMRKFVYDAATVNGVAMTGAKAKLAEAYSSPMRVGVTII